MNIQYKILDSRIGSEWARPEYATSGSAGLDLIACIDETIVINSGGCILIKTGLAIYIKDPNYAAMVLPRSGLGHKKGIVLGNLVGLIDSDYQGEIKISVWNRGRTAHAIHPGDRVAQLIFVPIIQPQLNHVESFDISSERHDGGFGSTGIRAKEPSST